jgi:hypothetical protein
MTADDKKIALQTYWEALGRSSWLTDEILGEASRMIVAQDSAFPSPRRLIDWCAEARPRPEVEVVPPTRQIATEVMGVISGADTANAPTGLRRMVESGAWDRWYAYGSASHRLKRPATTAEVDARLREIAREDIGGKWYVKPGALTGKKLTQLRGSLDAALAVRIYPEEAGCV